jgi:hypothetical protein
VPRYVLEDGFHSEWLREFDTAEAAVNELRRLEALTPPQLASEIGSTPCANHCGVRDLHVIEETGKEIARAKPR